MQISAQPFKRSAEHRHNALLSIGNVIGSGGSAVVTECSPLQRNWHFDAFCLDSFGDTMAMEMDKA